MRVKYIFSFSIVLEFLVRRSIGLKVLGLLPDRVVSTFAKPVVSENYRKMIDRVLNENKAELMQIGSQSMKDLVTIRDQIINDQIDLSDPDMKKIFSEYTDLDQASMTTLPIDVLNCIIYRKLSSCTSYLQIGTNTKLSYDLFIKTKLSNLKKCQLFIEEISSQLPEAIMADSTVEAIEPFLYLCLWSMRQDIETISNPILSDDNNRNRNKSKSPGNNVMKRYRAFVDGINSLRPYLVIDDLDKLMSILESKNLDNKGGNISIVISETGKGLIANLALAYILLVRNICETVTFHAKKYTVGEYGAIGTDIYGHIEHMADASNSDIWAVRHFGDRLRGFIFNGRLLIEEDEFWCLPNPLWDMPLELEEKLSNSKIILINGDDNYQRLLGCRKWSLSADSSYVFGYWHIPMCAIRIVNSNYICGLSDDTLNKIQRKDDNWLNSNKWGMIQLHVPPLELKTD